MQLIIVTTSAKDIFDVSWVEFNTPTGNYVIQPGHAPTILALNPGQPIIYCLKNGKEQILMIKRAIAQITRTNVTILASHIEN